MAEKLAEASVAREQRSRSIITTPCLPGHVQNKTIGQLVIGLYFYMKNSSEEMNKWKKTFIKMKNTSN